jgi:type I restriction enzyme, S subunit
MLEKKDTKGYANSLIKEILNRETPKHVSYVGNPKLMNNIMSSIRITVPVLPEQTKIATFLTLFDRKIEKEKEKLDALREQKKGLLQQMFV